MQSIHTTARHRGLRGVAASVAVVAGLSGLAACGESAGPEDGAVSTEDLQEIETDVSELQDRVAGLEGSIPEASADTVDDDALFGEDPSELIGQQVTISAAVSELVTDDGSAFRVAGDTGDAIGVISTNAPSGLQVEDVVEVAGTVRVVQRESFEEDFGVDPDQYFSDADAWFEEAEGQVAIAADSVAVVDEDADETAG